MTRKRRQLHKAVLRARSSDSNIESAPNEDRYEHRSILVDRCAAKRQKLLKTRKKLTVVLLRCRASGEERQGDGELHFSLVKGLSEDILAIFGGRLSLESFEASRGTAGAQMEKQICFEKRIGHGSENLALLFEVIGAI